MKVYDKSVRVGNARTHGSTSDLPAATPLPAKAEIVTDLSMVAGRLEMLVAALFEASGNIGGALNRFDNSNPINDATIPERPDSALGRVYSLIDQAEYQAGLLRLQSERVAAIA